MECLKQPLSEYQNRLQEACKSLPFPIEQACFFDIETTGLSPQVSSLYLLGAAYVEKDSWQLSQWFADDYISEADILTSFATLLSRFDTVIHYNGSTFDIPYLEKKYHAYHLASPFLGKKSLDLYRQLPRKKNLFSLPNQKLTTMERLFGFQRGDCYSGKDCIQLYTDYMQKKYFRDEAAQTLKHNLLLHNHDDLIGTVLCSQLLSYLHIQPSQPHYQAKEDALILSARLDCEVPIPLSYEQEGKIVSFEKDILKIHIPFYHGTLYHYFKDYQNYYYLPQEDMAIHKSVGTYVDASFRQKATAANCYIKRTGLFLPLPTDMETKQPTFQETRRSSRTYLPWTEQTVLSEEDCLAYLIHAIHKKR